MHLSGLKKSNEIEYQLVKQNIPDYNPPCLPLPLSLFPKIKTTTPPFFVGFFYIVLSYIIITKQYFAFLGGVCINGIKLSF